MKTVSKLPTCKKQISVEHATASQFILHQPENSCRFIDFPSRENESSFVVVLLVKIFIGPPTKMLKNEFPLQTASSFFSFHAINSPKSFTFMPSSITITILLNFSFTEAKN
jgi:hypothetical protein